MDCFASLAMTEKHTFAFSRHDAPEVCQKSPYPQKSEGAGNAGCALHPRSRVRIVLESCTRAYRAAESIRHPLRNGFTAYIVLSPVGPCSLSPSPLGSIRFSELDASIGASQDHTSSPYAQATLVMRLLLRPPRPVPRCDVGQRPSERDRMAIDVPLIWTSVKAKYFLFRGLTRFLTIRNDLPVGPICRARSQQIAIVSERVRPPCRRDYR